VVSDAPGDRADDPGDDPGNDPDADGGDGPAGRPRPRPWPPDERRGERLLQGDVWATATFAATSLAAALIPDPLQTIAVPVALVLFAGGCLTFLWAYAVALGRSRDESLTMAGVFFLADRVAPARVTRDLRLLLAIQVVVALVVAASRPYTALAFAVLVPMLGLGNMALWGARWGTFPPKHDATG
jgi:hypothetical protein